VFNVRFVLLKILPASETDIHVLLKDTEDLDICIISTTDAALSIQPEDISHRYLAEAYTFQVFTKYSI